MDVRVLGLLMHLGKRRHLSHFHYLGTRGDRPIRATGVEKTVICNTFAEDLWVTSLKPVVSLFD
jgi:hypothetical protein